MTAKFLEAARAALAASRPAPMQLGGADLHEDLSQIAHTIREIAPRRGSPLAVLAAKLRSALTPTVSLAATLRDHHTAVRELARVFRNDEDLDAKGVRAAYEATLDRWDARYRRGGPHAPWIAELLHAADASPRDGLFTCYAHKALPPDNNAHERSWGTVRTHQRRATGQNHAPNTLTADDGRTACAVLIAAQRPLRPEDAPRLVRLVLPRTHRQRLGATSRRSVRLSYRRNKTRFLHELKTTMLCRN